MALFDQQSASLLQQIALPRMLQSAGATPQQLQQAGYQQPQQNKILSSPAFSQALLSLGGALAHASERGYGTGSGLALGAQAFGNSIQQYQDRVRAEEEKATQNAIAMLKDQMASEIQDKKLRMAQAAEGRAAASHRAQMDDRERQRAAIEAIAKERPELATLLAASPSSAIDIYDDQFRGVQVDPDARVQGFDIAPGATPTKDDAKIVKSVVQAKKQLDTLVSDYEGLVEKYGWTTSRNTGGKLIDQKKAQIDLQAKNLEDLGALQEADRAILSDMLGSPVNGNPLNAKDISMTQIKDYKKYLEDRLNSTLETRGYIAKSPSAKAARGVDPQVWEVMTPEERALFDE